MGFMVGGTISAWYWLRYQAHLPDAHWWELKRTLWRLVTDWDLGPEPQGRQLKRQAFSEELRAWRHGTPWKRGPRPGLPPPSLYITPRPLKEPWITLDQLGYPHFRLSDLTVPRVALAIWLT